MPSSKGMLNRAGKPTRLRSCRETEQDLISCKMRVNRPSPCSGTSRTQRGVRPIATSALIMATKRRSYDLSKGRLRKTLRRRSSSRVLIERRRLSDLYPSCTKCAKNILNLGLADTQCSSYFGSGGRADYVNMAIPCTLDVCPRTTEAIFHLPTGLFDSRLHLFHSTRAESGLQPLSHTLPRSFQTWTFP